MNFRRDAVIQSWRTISDMQPVRFAAEASSLLGQKSRSELGSRTVPGFLEAVEVTAARRGVERWEPA
jgi:hypothetical protein